MIWVDHVEGRYRLTTGQGLESYLDSGETPVAETWQHLAATFDGTVARFYIDGTEVADRTISGGLGSGNTWRVGAYDGTPTGFFDGVIDEIRIYSRALSAAEIVTDRDEALADPDTTPPSAPGTLTATGGSAQASLTWGAATDTVGVARYNVHRSTTANFTPDASNRVAQPTDTSYLDSPLAAGTYYYRVTAQDAAGNVGPPSNQATATVTGDTTPPQVSITSPAAGTVSGPISVTANASDNLAVAGVQFKRGGQNLGAGGHQRALFRALGHAQRAQRHPRAHGGRPRHAREHGHLEPCHGHRVEHRRLHGRPSCGIRLRRGRGDDPRPTRRATTRRRRSRAAQGGRRRVVTAVQ